MLVWLIVVQLSCTSAKSLPRLCSCFNCRRTKSFPSLSGTSFHRWLHFSCYSLKIHQSKISECLQAIWGTWSKGKCLIRRRFLQESRAQPFPAGSQLLQEEHVFSPSPADTQDTRQRLSLLWLTRMTQLEFGIQAGFAKLLLCSTSAFLSHPSLLAACFLFQKVAFILILCSHSLH